MLVNSVNKTSECLSKYNPPPSKVALLLVTDMVEFPLNRILLFAEYITPAFFSAILLSNLTVIIPSNITLELKLKCPTPTHCLALMLLNDITDDSLNIITELVK